MWHKLDFEYRLEKSLLDKFGPDRGAKYFTRYSTFRDNLIEDKALRGIPAFEPGLTDHSEDHIASVMNNVYKLLGEIPESLITPIEHYCLALMILFHDTGNLFGRDVHTKNVYKVYDHFKGPIDNRQERSIIIRGTAAHGGNATDGSTDTLKELGNDDSIDGEKIRLRELASLLRFGDELAEGRNRTSSFMQRYKLYPHDSQIYHDYANITEILIDRQNHRISIAYNFYIDSTSFDPEGTKDLLDFSLKRIHKLDVERRYNKNYSELLSPFKYTIAQLNIWVDGQISPDLTLEKIELEDQFPLPGEGIDSEGMILNGKISSEDLIKKITQILLKT